MTASLTKWTEGILGVNEEAKTPEQILDIPGLFKRIHELQRAVGIDLTSIPTLEGSGGGGEDDKPPLRIEDLETTAAEHTGWLNAAAESIGELEGRTEDLEAALAAALARIAQLEGRMMSLTVESPVFGTPTLTINP